MRSIVTYFTMAFLMVMVSGFTAAEAQENTSKDTITVQIELPNGQTTKKDTVVEGDSLEIGGLPFPLHVMNGGKLVFSDSSVSHDITITISLPSFANVDPLQNQISFGDSVANAARFTVTAGDSTISPFKFDEPVTLSLPIPNEVPNAIGDQVNNLMLAYRDTSGQFESDGIRTIARDSVKGIVKAEVSHFSDVVMTSDAAAGDDSTRGNNSIVFNLETPSGQATRSDTVVEGETYQMSGFAFPFQYMNGSELMIPDSAVGEDVNISIEVPHFAKIDSNQRKVSFSDSIASAIEFNVSVGDSAISPYQFDTPLTLKMHIPEELPDQFGDSVTDLVLTYYDESGAFDTTGVKNISVDTSSNTVTASIAHFSTIAMTEDGETTTNIRRADDSSPQQFKLHQNYPNPFNPVTTIGYDLKSSSQVTLTVYNMLGRKVATLVNKHQQAGHHTVQFNASNLASGIYLYRIEAGNFTSIHKMTLMK